VSFFTGMEHLLVQVVGWPLLIGCVLGLIAGLLPGINGRVGLVMALPFALTMEPSQSIVFLVALHSVVHTTSSIPAVLFGAATSAPEAATVMDGVPMARKEPGRAVGLIINASLLGGALGALGLLLFTPIFKFFLQWLGSAEFAVLAVLGMLTIASLAGSSLAAGLTMGAFGWLISTIGIDIMTGEARFTFGQVDLWDGISTVAVVTGLFSVPELLTDQTEPKGTLKTSSPVLKIAAVLRSLREVLLYPLATLTSSVIGFVVGFVPGIGASVAVWLAYSQARLYSKTPEQFGKGAPEGIIAPEAANNAKEGGAFAPLLFLGIPGTTSLAIMVDVFSRAGIELGPSVLTKNSAVIWVVAFTIIFANALAVPLTLIVTPLLSRLTTGFRMETRALALVGSICVVIVATHGAIGLVQLALFSIIGIFAARFGIARAPLLLGFVMGPLLEKMVVRSSVLYGWEFLLRPGVWFLIVMCGAFIVYSLRMRNETSAPEGIHPQSKWMLLAIAVIMALAIPFVWQLREESYILPLMSVIIGISSALIGVWQIESIPLPEPLRPLPLADIAAVGLAIAAAMLVPYPIVCGLLVTYLFWKNCGRHPAQAAVAGLLVGLVLKWILT
jgi:putative tricarboxylic transport membrane protein